ncbi:MAG: hypothetical protein ACR2QJ_01295 [Geminicoccaceae bacterium]
MQRAFQTGQVSGLCHLPGQLPMLFKFHACRRHMILKVRDGLRIWPTYEAALPQHDEAMLQTGTCP